MESWRINLDSVIFSFFPCVVSYNLMGDKSELFSTEGVTWLYLCCSDSGLFQKYSEPEGQLQYED